MAEREDADREVDDAGGGDADVAWHVVSRIEELEGERRAAVLRAAGITVFYAVEAAAYRGVSLGFLDLSYARTAEGQRAISAICGAWVLAAAAVFVALRIRRAPWWTSYASTLADVLFLTAALSLTEGPRSPMVVGYFLVIALSALRIDLSLVRMATFAAALGYASLLGVSKWFASGEQSVPRYQQVVVLLAIVVAGVLVGQVVRRAKSIARAYANRRGSEKESSP